MSSSNSIITSSTTTTTTIHEDTPDHHVPLTQSITHHHEILIQWKLPIPWDIQVIQPQLHFYSFQYRDSPLKVPYTVSPSEVLDLLTSTAYFDPGKTSKFVVITHGFENDIDTPWLPQMKDEILKKEPTTLIGMVGWGGGAEISVLKYTQASANTQTVATWLYPYVKAVKDAAKKDLYVYGIAHSLGAHLLGLVGRYSRSFDRITGLDPAGPSFEKVNQENRLCGTDAKIVDVIHTDGYDTIFDPEDWFAPVNHYGTLIPLGTIDFYPNFGYRQPGISHFRIAESHHRSIELFLWSIGNPGMFITNQVLDGIPGFEKPVDKVRYVSERVEMGYHFDCSEEGLFYIETKAEVPWVNPPSPSLRKDHDTSGGLQSYCCMT